MKYNNSEILLIIQVYIKRTLIGLSVDYSLKTKIQNTLIKKNTNKMRRITNTDTELYVCQNKQHFRSCKFYN